jgi:Flp pilus assembly protein TadG
MRREDGAAAVEFALVLPILLAVVFGIVEFSWTFNQQISLSNAARESARYMAIHYAEADAESTAIGQGLASAPSAVGATITIDSECAPTTPSHDPLAVTATATLTAPGITGWFAPIFGSGLALTSESRMICGG